MSIQAQGSILVFDTRKRTTIRTIYNPLHQGVVPAMTLAMHEEQIYALGLLDGAVVIVQLPLSPESKYEARLAAIGPFGLQDCEHLHLLFPNTKRRSLVIIGRATNYLRKDGKTGGNSQWPIVLSVKEEDMGSWIELELLEEPLAVKSVEEADPKKVPQIESGSQSAQPDQPETIANNEQYTECSLGERQTPIEYRANQDESIHDTVEGQSTGSLKTQTTDDLPIALQSSIERNDPHSLEPGDGEIQDFITTPPRSFDGRLRVGFRHYETVFPRFR
jgi:hypothetical protein